MGDKYDNENKENKEYSNEEILDYNINLFIEAIELIHAANILLSLKNDI